MASPRFGTDGIRGIANGELTPEVVLALGRATARVLGLQKCVVGRDTRLSGGVLSAALMAGLASEGAEVVFLGTVPTPTVAYFSASLAICGLVVSASHNPFADNGVKIFSPGGVKLATLQEQAIEAELERLCGFENLVISEKSRPEVESGISKPARMRPQGRDVGTIVDGEHLLCQYENHVVSALGARRLEGLSVVLDCANGSASEMGPSIFRRLGATVQVISAEPDGININSDCGSTHPQSLSAAVVSYGADVGLAFDGDADRVLAVDANGEVIDGDHLLALFALDMQERAELRSQAVAVTVMTNLGFHRAMELAGIKTIETPVGDRHVLDAIEASSLALGGEQSGHIIFRELATTGDGVLTGVLLADLMLRSGNSLSDLAARAMTRLPQSLINVSVGDLVDLNQASAVHSEVEAVALELGANGRVLLRASGTEPVVRVMVEAPTQKDADCLAQRLAEVVRKDLG